MSSWSLDDFTMGRTLGTGSFGRVRFATFATNPNKCCVLKIMYKEDICRLKQTEHILAEKEILRFVSEIKDKKGVRSPHPFIVEMVCAFQNEHSLFMAIEFVNGGEFFSYLRSAGRLENKEAKFYAASVALVFEHLHEHDIVYRDLKPENMLLDQDGFLKLTDFGFAKVVPFKTYTLCGTPEYIAPEVLLNKGHGKGVDWWTLGILTFEMIAGEPPFIDNDPLGIYKKILKGSIDFPRFVDRHAKSFIKKLLVEDLTKRIGCLKAGSKDVKGHKWFNGFKFEDLVAKRLAPPIKPQVSGPMDTTNYDIYDEDNSRRKPFVESGDEDTFGTFDCSCIVRSEKGANDLPHGIPQESSPTQESQSISKATSAKVSEPAQKKQSETDVAVVVPPLEHVPDATAPETMPDAVQPQPVPESAPPQTLPGSVPPQTLPGSVPPQTLPGSVPPQTLPGSVPPQTLPGSTPPQTVPGAAPPVTLPGSSPAQ